MARTIKTREQFLAKVAVQPNGCWHWTGSIGATGYGRLRIDEHQVSAHRLAYEFFVGPIPPGLTLDHTCHNADPDCNLNTACLHRRCVNPEHLEAVPIRENILRGKAPPARRARSTTCDRGHPLSGENLYVTKDGHRKCRECGKLSFQRQVASGAHAARSRAYNKTEAGRAAASRYRAAHREEIREYGRAWAAANRERSEAQRRARRDADPEAFRAKQREYTRRCRARKRAVRAEEATTA